MIEITNLVKRFGEVTAVDHLTLTINDGVVGLVGHNGAGKSTLFRLIADVLTPDEGSIALNGLPHQEIEAKRSVFFLSDDPAVPANANDEAVFAFYANFFDVDHDRFLALLEKFGLPRNRKVSTFSKGMRRQLFICLALSVRADIYLLDEAFDGIDPLVLEIIKGEIISLSGEGKTIVISSHNIAGLENLVDRFVVLYKGKLSKEGGNEELGEEFVKYQCVSKTPLNEENLKALGFRVVNFKKVGSIYHFVLVYEEGIEEKIKGAYTLDLLERIAIAPDEIVALQMMLAKKEGEARE